jgi:hypothetical protein
MEQLTISLGTLKSKNKLHKNKKAHVTLYRNDEKNLVASS